MRVALLQDYARRFFPATRYLDYALRVERYTLTKAANLVLNVDGCIGSLFLDLLHSSSMFSPVRASPLLLVTASQYNVDFWFDCPVAGFRWQDGQNDTISRRALHLAGQWRVALCCPDAI